MWVTWLSISRRSFSESEPLRMESAATSFGVRKGCRLPSTSAKERPVRSMSARKLSSSRMVGSLACTIIRSSASISSRWPS